MRKVIDRERRFESILCSMLSVSELRPGIQDEDVDLCAVQLLPERLGEGSNIRKTCQIQWQRVDRRILDVARPKNQFRIGSVGDPLCGNHPETGGAACHYNCFHLNQTSLWNGCWCYAAEETRCSTPAHQTRRICRVARMSAMGSPSISTRSARRPGSITPRSCNPK